MPPNNGSLVRPYPTGPKMIVAVLGTTAELIKMAPVLTRLVDRSAEVEVWYTAMHVEGFHELREVLVPDIPFRVVGDPGRTVTVAKVSDVPKWLVEVMTSFRSLRRKHSTGSVGQPALMLVQGDTFTTVLGAVWGRVMRIPVAHIEAGMRSGSLLSPFPEEIDRRLVGRLAHIHYAPSEEAVANLARAKGRAVDTRGNTVVDALRAALPDEVGPGEPYGLVTLHRFEFMRKPEELEQILRLCQEASRRQPIRFMTGEHGRARLREHGLDRLFDDRLVITPKAPYQEFVPVLAGASFVLTDSGGLQQECAYLGIPCLVHRARTETSLGLGRNVVLSGLSIEAARRFLDEPQRFRAPSVVDSHHPSDVIVEDLAAHGFV